MSARSIGALGLALLVVLAGCTAPTHDGVADPTAASPEEGIRVLGGSLPVDPDVVFERVRRLMDADVPPPDAIRVVTRAELNASNGSVGARAPAFFETVDVDVDPGEGLNASERAGLENGATSLTVGTITILLGDNDTRAVHYVLAHELVHYVQAARGRATQLRRQLGRTTDAGAVFRSLLEGAAVYVTNAYIDRYVGENLTNSQLYFDLREHLAPGSYPRYVNSLYIHGWRYVAWRADAPDAMDPLYRRPPTTTEQVIHRIRPGAEPPKPLVVRAETGAYRRIGTDRLGEAFLRIFLQDGLDPSRAAAAAAGWGNDTLRTYLPADRGKQGYAWVLRFDDPANATEFVGAMRDALAARGVRENGTWALQESWARFDLRRVGSETAVLLIGTGRFVRNTSVAGRSGVVRLDLPGSGTRPADTATPSD